MVEMPLSGFLLRRLMARAYRVHCRAMRWGALLLLLGVGACSTGARVASTVEPAPEPQIALALSGQVLGVDARSVVVKRAEEIMALTPKMQTFAEMAVAGRRQDDQKVEALHQALLWHEAAGGMHIQYRSTATLTPQEAFRQREANCLGFSLLFVALARHVGLDAKVNDVTIPPTWNLTEGRVQFMRHVNARVDLKYSRDDMIVDLDIDNYRSYYPQREISDQIALAQFYNNLAMIQPSTPETLNTRFVYLHQALQLAPDQSYLWNNMAALYSRERHYDLAEALYRRALEHNPADLTALLNLSELYRHTGRDELYRELADIAENYRNNNPYYQYLLASELYDNASYELAAVKIETAIRRQPEEKRFYRLAADIYQSLGDDSKLRQAQSQL